MPLRARHKRTLILRQFLISSVGALCLSPRDAHGGRWIHMDSSASAPVFYNLSSADTFFAHQFLEDRPNMLSGWAPTPQARYPDHVMWAWVPNSGQQLEQVTGSSVCATLNRLGLERLLFVGDPLSRQMFRSLLMIIQADQIRVRVTKHAHFKDRSFKGQMHCPSGFVTLTFIENWYLGSPEFCGKDVMSACDPWLPTYVKSDEATLLVVNTGAHHHNETTYKGVIDTWLQELNESWDAMSADRRSNDCIYFRTTVPGHKNCAANTRPFDTPPPISDEHGWFRYPSYNSYAALAMQNILPNMRMLDVYPMTVLRGDGHLAQRARSQQLLKAGSAYAEPADLHSGDCLHYVLPGVPDWWNAFLFSELDAL
mmetsp:Transcript_1500/g.4543  ORF Transcript_1500/g.4543 Transcript_1500/m.4543 type:complete len:369 (+) Transcript_1500:72-1178(+)